MNTNPHIKAGPPMGNVIAVDGAVNASNYFSLPSGFNTPFDQMQAHSNCYYTGGVENPDRPMQYVQTPLGRFLSCGDGHAPLSVGIDDDVWTPRDPLILAPSAAQQAANAAPIPSIAQIYPGLWLDPSKGPIDIRSAIRQHTINISFHENEHAPEVVFAAMKKYHITAAELRQSVTGIDTDGYIRAHGGAGFGISVWDQAHLNAMAAHDGTSAEGMLNQRWIAQASETLDRQQRLAAKGMAEAWFTAI